MEQISLIARIVLHTIDFGDKREDDADQCRAKQIAIGQVELELTHSVRPEGFEPPTLSFEG